MTNKNPNISEANTEFTNYHAANGDIVSLRKDDVSFVRMVANKRSSTGYVVIVGMGNNAKDQHEFFDFIEESTDFFESMVELIGTEEFSVYKNNTGELVAIRKDDVAFVRNIKSKDGNGRVIIIGLTNNAKDQHEFFDDIESSEEFKNMFLQSLS